MRFEVKASVYFPPKARNCAVEVRFQGPVIKIFGYLHLYELRGRYCSAVEGPLYDSHWGEPDNLFGHSSAISPSLEEAVSELKKGMEKILNNMSKMFNGEKVEVEFQWKLPEDISSVEELYLKCS